MSADAPAAGPALESDPDGSSEGAVRRRAFEVVLEWVEERILDGQLRGGDHLPPERELATRLDVSRAAVREAVRTLQAQGVVTSSVGSGVSSGTTIRSVPTDALTRLLRQHVALANFALPDVVEVRIALERLSARLACAHATPEDLEAMGAWLTRMADPGIERTEFNDCDTRFHVALATSAGNALAADLTVAIRESMRLPILDRFRTLDTWDDVVTRLRADHEAIHAAVVRRDPVEAERLVEDHIRSAWVSLAPAVRRPASDDALRGGA